MAQPIRLNGELRKGLRLLVSDARLAKAHSIRRIESALERDVELLHGKEGREDMEVTNVRVTCPIEGCAREFNGVQGLLVHMGSFHASIPRKERKQLAYAAAENVEFEPAGRTGNPTPLGNDLSVIDVKPDMLVTREEVDHPAHYGGDTPYEVIKVLEAWGFFNDALLFNAITYIARAGKKGDEITDLRKAIFYIERKIATLVTDAD